MRSTFTIRRPSAALVVALVALFAALGGTGYAAVTLSGRDIQKRSIPANRVVPNALTGNQINEAKLGPVPVAGRALTAETAATATTATTATNADNATNAQNAVNAQRAQDSQQLQGRDATRFLANSLRVVTVQDTVRTGGSDTVTVACLPTEKGIGGGAAWLIPATETATELDAQLNSSFPLPTTGGSVDITGWRAAGINRTGADRVLRAYVICVPKTAQP